MIPNVCMAWAKRQATCHYCNQPIEVATPEVVVFYWNKGQEGRRFNVKQYYHPQHWVEQGLDYLKMNPYEAASKGREPMALTTEQRTRRRSLLTKKASLEQRKQRLKAPYPERLLYEAKIDQEIASLMLQMQEVGGVPESWIDRLME